MRLADRFAHLKWLKILNRYARQVLPQLDDVLHGREYYWVAAEYATDVMFKTSMPWQRSTIRRRASKRCSV